MFVQSCLGINEKGHLTIGGVDTVSLAEKYGTPLYLMDEDTVRKNCRTYKSAMKKYYGDRYGLLFASKTCSFKQIYRIIAEEGFGADAVSSGELYTAKQAGFPMEKIYFHGNNKTDADIALALDFGVGCIVADNHEELDAIEEIAAAKNAEKVKILLRITPGIDPHTHKAVITGNIDSKFGSAIATGQAMDIVKYALSKKHIKLAGIHCHIGSQIFESKPFCDAAENMIKFMSDVKKETGYELDELNLGGGFGVPYVGEQLGSKIDYDKNISEVHEKIKSLCEQFVVKHPVVLMEPGRSITADAGITLYTVGSVKKIPMFKNYVSIDGGMTDNPRYALYQSLYDAVIADRAGEKKDFSCTIAGRCCESGDLIAENIKLQSCRRGDILAVEVTGAYNYSMASNYNRVPRPPVVIVANGESYIAVKRETFENITENDI